MTYRTLHSWSFHMKFIKLSQGSYRKFHRQYEFWQFLAIINWEMNKNQKLCTVTDVIVPRRH